MSKEQQTPDATGKGKGDGESFNFTPGTRTLPDLVNQPGASTQMSPEVIQQFFQQNFIHLQQMFLQHQLQNTPSPSHPMARPRASRVEPKKLGFTEEREPPLEISDESHAENQDDRKKDKSASKRDQLPYTHYSQTPGKGEHLSPPRTWEDERRGQEFIHSKKGSPFTPEITDHMMPYKFKLPSNLGLYDGNSDPDDHLSTYSTTMNIYAFPMAVWCKEFPTTLRDKARLWFESLRPGSISSFTDLERQFRFRFLQRKKFQKTRAELMTMRQGSTETLREYVDRFNDESLQLGERSDEFVVSAFINGLRHDKFYRDLMADPPTTMEELLQLANKFSRADEADRKKEKWTPSARIGLKGEINPRSLDSKGGAYMIVWEGKRRPSSRTGSPHSQGHLKKYAQQWQEKES